MKFEGWMPAANYAQIESKKTGKEYYVIISRKGGIHYLVKKDISDLQGDEKVITKYVNGDIVK